MQKSTFPRGQCGEFSRCIVLPRIQDWISVQWRLTSAMLNSKDLVKWIHFFRSTLPDFFTRELREEKSYFADVKKHIIKESNAWDAVWTWAMAKLWALSNAQPIQLHWDAIMCGINVCWKGEALSFVHDRMLQFHMYQPFLVVGDGTYLRCWMEWWLYNDILYNCRWKNLAWKKMRRVKGWRCPGFSISGYPSQMWKSRFSEVF